MWLAANNREEEAEEILQKMARWNGVTTSGRLILEPEDKLLKDKENNEVYDDKADNSKFKVKFSRLCNSEMF